MLVKKSAVGAFLILVTGVTGGACGATELNFKRVTDEASLKNYEKIYTARRLAQNKNGLSADLEGTVAALFQKDAARLYVATTYTNDEEKVVGVCVLCPKNPEGHGGEPEALQLKDLKIDSYVLRNIFVTPDVSGKRVAQSFFNYVLQDCLSEGCHAVHVATLLDSSNLKMVEFAKAVGFKTDVKATQELRERVGSSTVLLARLTQI